MRALLMIIVLLMEAHQLAGDVPARNYRALATFSYDVTEVAGYGYDCVTERAADTFFSGSSVVDTAAKLRRSSFAPGPEQFTGKERDTETGLDYFGARYLSGAMGRFTSADAPLVDQHAEDPQSWNLYSYVRNNPLRYTDPTGRCLRPNETLESCGDYLLGGLKAVGNIPSGIINAPNRLANALISPFIGFQFPDAVPQTFTPSNEDQRHGMEAANVVMLVSPLAEAAAGKVAQVMGTVEAGAAATKTGIQANKAAGEAFRDQVASGLAAEGRGVQTEVYKKTPFGGRRIDIEVSDRPGGTLLGGIETKAGNSRYPAAQRAKDEYLRRQGYPVNVVRDRRRGDK